MRVCKGFAFLFALSLVLGAAAAEAQVSDSDFFSIVPADLTVPEDVDTNFHVVVYLNNATTAQSLTIPFTFAGSNANLRIDTTFVDGQGNKGVTQLALGSNPTWTIYSSLYDQVNQTILLGYVSFGTGLPPSDDSLVAIHFDLDAGGGVAAHDIDSTLLAPSNNLRITTVLAEDIAPQWTKGTIHIGTNSAGDPITPLTYGLDQNYPNPFNASTQINFSLARPGKVELVVFNVIGQTVKTLVDKELEPAAHAVVWDGTNDQGTTVASGTYFYRLKIDDTFEETLQMVLLK